MKHLLFAVFENTRYTRDMIHELARNHINGTVLASTSLKHFMNDIEGNEINFINLRHLEKISFEDNTTFYALLDENQIATAQKIIREQTEHFKKVKGGMFVLPVETYEGSF